MTFQFSVSTTVNLLAFLGLTIATYTIFFFGRQMDPKKGISVNLFTLALGINLIGISHLLRIWLESASSPLVLVTVALGSFFMAIGVFWVFYEKGEEINNLKRREDEIKAVIAKLKDKYYQQELSEEDLKSAYSDLLKELAEIEVKLSNHIKRPEKI